MPELIKTVTMNERGIFLCRHTDAYLEHCCDGAYEEGRPTCGCFGQDMVVCPAADCTGILDHEIDELFERILSHE